MKKARLAIAALIALSLMFSSAAFADTAKKHKKKAAHATSQHADAGTKHAGKKKHKKKVAASA